MNRDSTYSGAEEVSWKGRQWALKRTLKAEGWGMPIGSAFLVKKMNGGLKTKCLSARSSREGKMGLNKLGFVRWDLRCHGPKLLKTWTPGPCADVAT